MNSQHSNEEEDQPKFVKLYSLSQIFKWDINDLSSKIFNIKLGEAESGIFYQLRR